MIPWVLISFPPSDRIWVLTLKQQQTSFCWRVNIFPSSLQMSCFFFVFNMNQSCKILQYIYIYYIVIYIYIYSRMTSRWVFLQKRPTNRYSLLLGLVPRFASALATEGAARPLGVMLDGCKWLHETLGWWVLFFFWVVSYSIFYLYIDIIYTVIYRYTSNIQGVSIGGFYVFKSLQQAPLGCCWYIYSWGWRHRPAAPFGLKSGSARTSLHLPATIMTPCWGCVDLGAMLDPSWAVLGPCWGYVELCWDHVGSCSVKIGAILEVCWGWTGLCWPILKFCWGFVGPCGVYVGAKFAHLEQCWGYGNATWFCLQNLAPAWDGHSKNAPWTGLSWPILGLCWGLCWGMLGPCSPILGLCWGFVDPPEVILG